MGPIRAKTKKIGRAKSPPLFTPTQKTRTPHHSYWEVAVMTRKIAMVAVVVGLATQVRQEQTKIARPSTGHG